MYISKHFEGVYMETRGYETINDRTSGWGHSDGTQPTADPAAETTDDRLERQYLTREKGVATSNPDNKDRLRGKGGTFVATGGADDGYGVKAWEGSDTAVGTGYDITVSGTNVDQKDTSEEASANRTALALPTSDLVEPGIETVGSIVDRTDGWGHSTGTQTDRKD